MNTLGSAHRPPDHGPWRAWAHLGVLTALATSLEVAFRIAAEGGVGVGYGGILGALPAFYFGLFPVLLAIGLGMLPFSREALRRGVTLALFVTVLMVGLDLLGTGATVGAERVAVLPGGVNAAASPGSFTDVPLIGTALAFLRGSLTLPLVRSTSYTPGDPLLLAALAVVKAGHLCLPLILTGIMLGVQAWVADHVSFGRPLDAMVARMVLAWVLAPTAFYFIQSWSLRLLFQVLFRGASLLVPLLPVAVFAIVALIGLRTAARVARSVD